MYDAAVHAKAIELTRLAVEMTAAAGSGHPTSAASLAHIVTVLMYDHLRWDPQHPAHPCSDRLVLSEGHAVPIIYAAGADLGIAIGREGHMRPMTREDAMNLRVLESEIDGHPNPVEGFPFFDAATGSLGQGLSVAAGIGAAARLDGKDRRIYCLIGDGESREGQIAEALEFIADAGLANVCPVFNCNRYGQSAPVSPLESPESAERKLGALGYRVRMIDGHCPSEIREALREHAEAAGGPEPFAIVAKTVKGWGSAAMQKDLGHGKPPAPEQLPEVIRELEETGESLGAAWSGGAMSIRPPVSTPPPAAPRRDPPSFTEMLRRSGRESVLTDGKWPTRKGFGLALQALGHVNPDVVVLDGDVSNSTYTEWFAGDDALANRYFEGRIAEQNMVSAAVGLAAAGKIPFVSSFGKFVTRAYDQIEMAINSGANIKVAGSHAGVSLAADGPSQMALPDVAWFHALTTVNDHRGRPAACLLQPADAFAAYALTCAMAQHDGFCYIRTLRPDTPLLYSDDTEFTPGGHQLLEGGEDLLLIATGYMVHRALEALDALQAAGIDAALLDLYSLPFDASAVCELARGCRGRVLTLEDNYGGGAGAAVAGVLAEQGDGFRLKQMHVRKTPKSARSPEELLTYLKLSEDDIVQAALSLLNGGKTM